MLSAVNVDTPSSEISQRYYYDSLNRTNLMVYELNSELKNEIQYTFGTRGTEENTTTTTNLIEDYVSIIKILTDDLDADGLPDEEIISANPYEYSYNNKKYISGITLPNNRWMYYYYDDIGQLVSEDNGELERSYSYEYDKSGNLLSKKTYYYSIETASTGNLLSTDTYSYSNSAWGDLLTAYNGIAITYDGIGNPLSYYNGSSFTWQGRRLSSATIGNTVYYYKYNSNNIRTSKTVNGVTTTYYFNGNNLLAEETNGNITLYVYDASGLPIGMQYHAATWDEDTWEIYYYEKNLQGDIVSIYNQSGTKLVYYSYDAWGNFTETYYNSAEENPRIVNNPFTYRGYYYDRDLELYYLNSRYYDSNTGRFINADSVLPGVSGSLNGYNLFAYCFNNPVMMTDKTGNIPEFIKKFYGYVENGGEWLYDNIIVPVQSFAEEVAEDIDDFDIDNTDEQAVLDADIFSAYKGHLVIKIPSKERMGFSFGVIFLGNSKSVVDDVKHEYGHTVQLDNMGIVDYVTDVAAPSVTCYWLNEFDKLPFDYYSSPWESEADEYGGVVRGEFSDPWTEEDGYTKDLIKIFFE